MQKEVIGDATLYLGDCLDVLPLMTKGDADLLLTDPPYGVEFVGRAGCMKCCTTTTRGLTLRHILTRH